MRIYRLLAGKKPRQDCWHLPLQKTSAHSDRYLKLVRVDEVQRECISHIMLIQLPKPLKLGQKTERVYATMSRITNIKKPLELEISGSAQILNQDHNVILIPCLQAHQQSERNYVYIFVALQKPLSQLAFKDFVKIYNKVKLTGIRRKLNGQNGDFDVSIELMSNLLNCTLMTISSGNQGPTILQQLMHISVYSK